MYTKGELDRVVNLVIEDLDLVLVHGNARYKLLIKRDDCVRLLIVDEDEDKLAESGCMGEVSLDSILRFIGQWLGLNDQPEDEG